MNLVIQNGTATSHIDKYLPGTTTIIKSFETNVANIDMTEYNIVIILGGQQSICDDDVIEPNLVHVIDLIVRCVEIEKPLVGICLGCQLIARTLGCDVKSSGRLNVGYDTTICGYDNILRCHTNHVVPHVQFEFDEYFDQMLYVFKHKRIYGIQCHPDIPPEYVADFLEDSDTIKYAALNKDVIDENNRRMIVHILNELMITQI